MKEAIKTLLRLIIPKACPACGGQLGSQVGICRSCKQVLRPQLESRSPLCPQVRPHLLNLGHHTGKIRRIVSALKYQGARDLAEPLADLLAEAVPPSWQISAVVAVPLHPRRLRERGYNQSELLARAIAVRLGVPYLPLLRRVRYTQQQAKKQGSQRQQNVAGAFEVDIACDYPTGTVLLIDDVITTGFTLKECTEAMNDVGLVKVCYVVLAH